MFYTQNDFNGIDGPVAPIGPRDKIRQSIYAHKIAMNDSINQMGSEEREENCCSVGGRNLKERNRSSNLLMLGCPWPGGQKVGCSSGIDRLTS